MIKWIKPVAVTMMIGAFTFGMGSFSYGQGIGTVTGTSVNVRQQPSTDAQKIISLKNGDNVQIMNDKGDWYQISFDNKEGWIHKDYVKAKMQITGNGVNLRVAPSTDCEVSGTLSGGTLVEVKSTEQDWYAVQTEDGQIGWVYSKYVGEVKNEPVVSRGSHNVQVDKLLQTAMSLRGKPYSYGSNGPNAFDCSGFTSYVYRQNGIKIDRDSRSQATNGVKVSKEELQRGDLVFFDTSDNGSINHVGIYIGNGNFIHASSGKAGSVTISGLDDSFYRHRYITARRILK
ncbi:SH3 domain-containing C40 family peptidase [Inediibacterium massiliense]|uniref:C40 family peptidase n=1 Tax=Inediibacterium massiliense TaxID=1658111 RepID=UPI0006B66FAD|nr:SH3 domain-containing C40 family peptidase [Inediibacterium massiliense]